jgi:hypothetical protein
MKISKKRKHAIAKFDPYQAALQQSMESDRQEVLEKTATGPVFTLMGVPYIFDPYRAVLRKAGTSWEQFVADLSKEADDDPCWEGYEAVGIKKKRGKMVPNCVPVNR